MSELLIPVKKEHAAKLFLLIWGTSVTDTILWDGPESIESYESGFAEREKEVARGLRHMQTIVDPESGSFAGTADIRPDSNYLRADIGLWIGTPFQGRGLGTRVVHELTRYGFEVLGLNKIEGSVFVGNDASRRVFEKCGYSLEGTIRSAVRKRGVPVDEWIFGILKAEFLKSNQGSVSSPVKAGEES
jgi:RimJ/RimL family protein N-acetyltransferase